jgi:hypothetical protein
VLESDEDPVKAVADACTAMNEANRDLGLIP